MQGDSALGRALAVVRDLRLRCDWDRAQTPRSLRPYLLEEAHELDQAIKGGDPLALRDELGDVLLHLAFQIVIAEENSQFNAEAVTHHLEMKMRRRHPHLYEGVAEPDRETWERHKGRDRQQAAGTLSGLPATIRSWGRLTKGKVAVSARHSTQFASALLLISSHAGIEVELAEPEEPHGYIAMTRNIMETFRRDYVIEPDLSSASYFAAAGFMTGVKVEAAGWPLNSLQMDGQFPRFLPPPATVSRLRDLGDSVMT